LIRDIDAGKSSYLTLNAVRLLIHDSNEYYFRTPCFRKRGKDLDNIDRKEIAKVKR